jgi:hypothetical protein
MAIILMGKENGIKRKGNKCRNKIIMKTERMVKAASQV